MRLKTKSDKSAKGGFTKVPTNIDFSLPSPAFRLLVWLMKHQDGFTMNEKFIKNGIGMDYRTLRRNLVILEQNGDIKLTKLEKGLVELKIIFK